MHRLQKVLSFISDRLALVQEPFFPGPPAESDEHLMIKQAHQEWQNARQHFNQITEPEMVDYAVYSLKAAEQRFIYLLKEARRGIPPNTKREAPQGTSPNKD